MTVISRLVLFVSSFAPLLALFAILDSFGAGWPSVVCALAAVSSVLALWVVWILLGRSSGTWLVLESSRNRDADVMAFFVTYVVPFAAAPDANVRTRFALASFAIITAALYVRSAIFYVHPLLLLIGYHVFEATKDAGIPIIVITRRRFLRQHDTLWATMIAPGVYREMTKT